MKEIGTLRRDRQTDRQNDRRDADAVLGERGGAQGAREGAQPPLTQHRGAGNHHVQPRPTPNQSVPPKKEGEHPAPTLARRCAAIGAAFYQPELWGGPSPGLARPEFGRCFLGILQPRGCSCPNPDSSCWPWLGSALPPGHGVVVLHVRPAIKRDGLGVSSCLLDDHWRGKNGEMSWNRAWPGQENLPLSPSAVPGDMPAPSQPLERFYWGFRAGEPGAGSCFCSQPT